ncbi:MAG TPA: YbhB/YbcL family Raf kinase inhibitor-like protein [Trinickia sp.]|nr:YbhB/YbcL family Raf kinase inhibitor-like protein [Trinickia sp.]
MKTAACLLSLLTGLTLAAVSPARAADFRVTTDSQPDGHFAGPQYSGSFGCHGANVSPHIAWRNAPAGTKSFVVTVYDQDAPTGSGWWHWIVADIPANVDELAAGAGSADGTLPAGAKAVHNDAGQTRYLGVCPPAGETHRYLITVNALKVDKLELPDGATPAMVGYLTHVNSLGKATTTALANR